MQSKFPNLQAGESRLHDIVDWPNETLTRRHQEYIAYSEEERFMPRAQEVIKRIINHIEFEQRERFRNGE